MNSFLSLLFLLNTLLALSSQSDGFRMRREDHESSSDNDLKHKVHQHNKHWGYRNEDRSLLPHDWHKSHPNCYGKQQSPIDINFYSTQFDATLKEIQISSKNTADEEKWQIKNNGHSVVLTPLTRELTFVLSPENEQFKMLQMHFHWRGSEHYINGRKFAGELHMVHQSTNDSSRFAVLGFLIEQTNSDNPIMEPIVSKLVDVIKYNSQTETTHLKIDSLRPTKLSKYFRYSGSLTTPGCDEVVEWLVVDGPVLLLSEDQLLEFQTLEDSHSYPILTNSRPVQSLNDRLVRRSFYNANLLRSKYFIESASGYNGANHYFGNQISFIMIGLVVSFLRFIN